jgi:hypothetical protein
MTTKNYGGVGIKIGEYILDTLQIYFPWDDDLYTELKSKGFGEGKSKKLPLIYTDNTEATIGEKEKRRKYVIEPSLFGRTYSELGWKETDKPSEPIIPAEKPLLRVTLVSLSNRPCVKFTILPTVNDKEQYHLEYSAMAAFGKMYSNWVTLYLKPDSFKDIFLKVKNSLKIKTVEKDAEIKTESQMAQREEMKYVELPILQYKFCLAAFRYAVDFFEHNGVKKEDIPCLMYDCSFPKINEKMSPYVKLGVVHTKETTGFEERKPQAVMKIAQDLITKSKRGKMAKAKGIIIYESEHENYLLLDAREFVGLGERVFSMLSSGHVNSLFIAI